MSDDQIEVHEVEVRFDGEVVAKSAGESAYLDLLRSAISELGGRAQQDAIISGLEILTIKEGDVVVIRTEIPDGPDGPAAIQFIQQALEAFTKARGLVEVQFLLLPPNMDIKLLNPEKMRALGWRRSSDLELAHSLPGPGNRTRH